MALLEARFLLISFALLRFRARKEEDIAFYAAESLIASRGEQELVISC